MPQLIPSLHTWEEPGDPKSAQGQRLHCDRKDRRAGLAPAGPGDPLSHLFLGLKEHLPIFGLEARHAPCSGFSSCRATPAAVPVLPVCTGGRWRHVCSAAAGQMIHPLLREQRLHCRLQVCCSQAPSSFRVPAPLITPSPHSQHAGQPALYLLMEQAAFCRTLGSSFPLSVSTQKMLLVLPDPCGHLQASSLG